MKLRRAHPAELGSLPRVFEASVLAMGTEVYSDEQVETWARLMQPEPLNRGIADGRVLVAEFGSEVVGWGEVSADYATIDTLFVSPDHARRGIGTAILAELERCAVAHGAESVRLRASLNALPFYLARGYSQDERTMVRVANGSEFEVVYMSKRLRVRADGGE